MAENSTNVSVYCNLTWFHDSYVKGHGVTSLLVCIVGSIMNTLNIIVLTRKEMRSSTNLILTGIAIADLLVMLEYIPFTFVFYIVNSNKFTFSCSNFVLFHSFISQSFHTISIALTLILAIWRYVAIAHPHLVQAWYQMSTTALSILAAYIVCPLLCAPVFLQYEVTPMIKNGTNETMYVVRESQLSRDHGSIRVFVHLILYGILIKLLPCIILTVLCLRIIFALIQKKERRKQLLDSSGLLNSTSNIKKSKKHGEKEKQSDRTTRMLLAVLILFLMTEFPQAILGFLSAIEGEKFFSECYSPLSDFMDMIALCNAGINFVLYCCMSRQFRVTFRLLFRPKCLGPPVSSERDPTQVTQITNV